MKAKTPTKAWDLEFTSENHNQGWAFGRPVGIKTSQWPRSSVNGLPMAHLFIILVPQQYRVKGDDFVAISLFQADDHVALEVEGVEDAINEGKFPDDSENADFWNSLKEYTQNKHPKEIHLNDIIDGNWSLIWLTREEFEGDPVELPNKNCIYPGYDSQDGLDCFSEDKDPQFVKLVERKDDPNVGKDLEDFPDEEDENAYIDMYSDKGQELGLEDFSKLNHFGGTANPVQYTPAFSPFYFEFEENLGNANMGGGNGQIDLKNDELDWACG